MFFRKVTSKSNGKEYTYVKLIENYREGNKVKQRVVANLGNIEDLTPDKVQGLITGLSRICGISPNLNLPMESKKVLHFGDVLAIHKVWDTLGLSDVINSPETSEKSPIDLSLLTELMVMNQIIKPRSKQTIIEWYRCLYLPGLEGQNLECEHFYNVLDHLNQSREKIEEHLFKTMREKTNTDVNTVFCQLIRGYFERQDGFTENNLKRYFLSGVAERKQVDMGILVTKDGIPIGHRMFLGHFSDGETVPRRITQIQQQYGIKNCIFVGDQNVITDENLQLLVTHGHQYIVGLEMRFNHEIEPLKNELRKPSQTFIKIQEDLFFKEINHGNTRYLLCFNPRRALQKQHALENRLAAVEAELQKIHDWVKEKCSKNAKITFYKATSVLKDVYCKRYFECSYDEKNYKFTYSRKQEIIDKELSLYGKFVIRTNCQSLTPEEIIEAYNNHNEMRDQFRVINSFDLKSSERYTESRIRGHVFVCVLAYLLEKTMDVMLREHGLDLGTKKALELVEDVKVTINRLNDSEIKSVTEVMNAQQNIFTAVGLKKIPKVLDKNAVL